MVIIRVLFLTCALIFLFACTDSETRSSDVPLTKKEAELKAGIKLPVSGNARNIRFHLSGSTQDWDLYVSFQAGTEDIQRIIASETDRYVAYRKSLRNSVPKVTSFAAIESEVFSSKLVTNPPKWWQPKTIKEGYFAGSLDPLYGPKFWVNKQNSTVYIFEHF